MDTKLLKKYSEIKFNISKLTKEAKEIEGQVSESLQEILKETGNDNVKSDFGTLYFMTRKSWKYSDDCDSKVKEIGIKIDELTKPLSEEIKDIKEPFEIEVKELREKEEADGIATCEEKKSVAFRSK